MADQNPLQIIDFGPFLSGHDIPGVSTSILDSFKLTGFVYLVNHGVPEEKIASLFEWLTHRVHPPHYPICIVPALFFSSYGSKTASASPSIGNTSSRVLIRNLSFNLGYSAPGMERIIRPRQDDISQLSHGLSDVPDVKESFDLGREGDELMSNIWLPDGVLPGFKEACLDFFQECYILECAILRSLAIGFGLSDDYFLPFHTEQDNQMRLVRYPSVSSADLRDGKVSRIDSHSDFGSLTILFQDNVGGLEVEDLAVPGHFKPINPVPHSVIVNAGDFLMRWSNDTIKSAVHRVRAPLGKYTNGGMVPDRYSIPYFACADFSTIVDCIPGTWSEENPKKYQPISAKEYIMKRLAAAY